MRRHETLYALHTPGISSGLAEDFCHLLKRTITCVPSRFIMHELPPVQRLTSGKHLHYIIPVQHESIRRPSGRIPKLARSAKSKHSTFYARDVGHECEFSSRLYVACSVLLVGNLKILMVRPQSLIAPSPHTACISKNICS